MLMKMLCVGIGGFFGCISRFLIMQLSIFIDFVPLFPWGTLIANVLGCFFIGLMTAYIEFKHIIHPNISAFIITGFLGGLTTFSTFSYENVSLMREGQLGHSLLYMAISIILGLTMVWLGYKLAYNIAS